MFMQRLKSQLIVLAICLSPLVSLAAESTFKGLTDAEYWQQVDINFAFLQSQLKESKCRQDESVFMGCFSAINSLAQAAEPPLIFLPKVLLSEPEYYAGAIRQDFGPFVLAELNREGMRLNERSIQFTAREKFLRRKMTSDRLAREVKLLMSNQDFTFAQAMIQAFNHANVNPEKTNLLIARAYNEYYKVGVDAHGGLTPTRQFEDNNEHADEIAPGIGAEFYDTAQGVMVLRTDPQTPARRLGLLPGDLVTLIDGQSTKSMNAEDVSLKITKGAVSSFVALSVSRGGRPLNLRIRRVFLKNLLSEIINVNGVSIGYMRLRSFMDEDAYQKVSACSKVRAQIEWFESKNVKGIVFDLRHNLGGTLDQSVCIASLFFGRKTVLFESPVDGRNPLLIAAPEGTKAATQLPVVVLINQLSASAAEIVAGALQDQKRAWLVGERSYGKGTIQTVAPSDVSGSHKISTQARFLQPSGRTNHIQGIMPDFEVPFMKGQTEDQRFFIREAEQFPNALSTISRPWIQSRPTLVSTIDSCVKSRSARFDRQLIAHPSEANTDYQLYQGLLVLECETRAKAESRKANSRRQSRR